LVFGGEQEQRLCAGTENVAGIVAAGYAIEESIAKMSETAKRLKTMVDRTVNGIQARIPIVRVNGNSEDQSGWKWDANLCRFVRSSDAE